MTNCRAMLRHAYLSSQMVLVLLALVILAHGVGVNCDLSLVRHVCSRQADGFVLCVSAPFRLSKDTRRLQDDPSFLRHDGSPASHVTIENFEALEGPAMAFLTSSCFGSLPMTVHSEPGKRAVEGDVHVEIE